MRAATGPKSNPNWGNVSDVVYCHTPETGKHSFRVYFITIKAEGVVAPWFNPLTLQPEQSGGVGSSPGRVPPLERHDKGSRTRLGLLYFSDPSAWR